MDFGGGGEVVFLLKSEKRLSLSQCRNDTINLKCYDTEISFLISVLT